MYPLSDSFSLSLLLPVLLLFDSLISFPPFVDLEGTSENFSHWCEASAAFPKLNRQFLCSDLSLRKKWLDHRKSVLGHFVLQIFFMVLIFMCLKKKIPSPLSALTFYYRSKKKQTLHLPSDPAHCHWICSYPVALPFCKTPSDTGKALPS